MALADCRICGADFEVPWQGSVTPRHGICEVCEGDEELMQWFKAEERKRIQLQINKSIEADREHQTHGI